MVRTILLASILNILIGFVEHATWSQTITNPLLICLGQEEFRIHKQHFKGPLYKLNKSLIDELLTLDHILIKESYLNRICPKNSPASPSENLIYELLMNKSDVFDIPNNNSGTALLSNASINSFLSEVPRIFLDWISDLQLLSPSPDCLDRHIPFLNYFKTRLHHLEEDLGPEELMNDRTKIQKLFGSLKHYDKILDICKKEMKKTSSDKQKIKTKKSF